MRCKGMKMGPVKRKGVVQPGSNRSKNCGKVATVFYKVHYSELFRYADNGVNEDVLGFCEDCARGKDKPSGYLGSGKNPWYERKVLHLRGEIAHVEPHDGSGIDESIRTRRLHDGKRELLRVMSTRSNADLADDWEEVFDLALKEFTVREVMGG